MARLSDAATVPAEVLCVKDGDTIRVRAHIWIGQTIDVDVRLKGIDAPELKGKCPMERERALEAKNRVLDLLGLAPEVNVCDSQPKTVIYLKKIKKDKYGGRVIAFAETEDGADLQAVLLSEGLAVPYFGKTKNEFCQTIER